MKNDEKLRDARIINKLPHLFGRNEALPEGLVGATVFGFGAFEEPQGVEGGLVIDYRPAGETEIRRAVLAFDEIAVWQVAYFSGVGP